jgi:hypothetical protein
MATSSSRAVHDGDNQSEFGDLFETGAPAEQSAATDQTPRRGAAKTAVGVGGVTRDAGRTPRVIGRGPVPNDKRKFKYDRAQARGMSALSFGVTRADRLTAEEAGEVLHRLHVQFGIDRETEDVLCAFDKALMFEHTVNGASLLQDGRGYLEVADTKYELSIVKRILGHEQRKFFRAYADDIADVNQEVIDAYDAYDPASVEKHGQLMQVAVERGLQKFPHLAHDSSDACVRIGVEARTALMASKRSVLEVSVNKADQVYTRVNDKVATAGAPAGK